MKGKYLITTDNWFVAPDGKDYKAVWGEVKVMTAVEALGIEPNRNSANWMVRVGSEEHHIILAGCQIHYAAACPERPNTDPTLQRFRGDKEAAASDTSIYIPEAPELKEVEIIEGKEVEWLTNKAELFIYLKDNINLFESHFHMDSVLGSVSQDMKRYRIFRNIYARRSTVEIEFTSGRSIVLGPM